ncbi:MAG: glycolate oxidase subunit GlcE [Rhodospirillaceae bacterium]|nr:glycolate oxidase subunit GlcE [Rhodospirillaceae bacterium]
MAEKFDPATTDDVRAIVADALASKTPLEIAGNGSKREIGRPVDLNYVLSTAQLSGVSLYEPDELVLRAGPGTPMKQLRLQLEQHGQMLAFEPPDYGPLLGGAADEGTIGGIVAGNLAGPRRVKAGAARDHFLGVVAVSGRGEVFKSGGRVVKNVTGYDLCKLMAGSWGTLGVMTEVTVKVLPASEKTRTVLVSCADATTAIGAMTRALSSPHDVSAAAWLPASAAARSGVSYVSAAHEALAAVRVEGIGSSVDARCIALRDELSEFGEIEELHTHNSVRLWDEIRDVRLLGEDPDNGDDAIWRISVPPAAAPGLLERLGTGMELEAFVDWGGGLIWARVSGMMDAGSYVIRRAMVTTGGHALLVRARHDQRIVEPVFHPEAAGVERLTRNIKEAFDPGGILNPGRMFNGI